MAKEPSFSSARGTTSRSDYVTMTFPWERPWLIPANSPLCELSSTGINTELPPPTRANPRFPPGTAQHSLKWQFSNPIVDPDIQSLYIVNREPFAPLITSNHSVNIPQLQLQLCPIQSLRLTHRKCSRTRPFSIFHSSFFLSSHPFLLLLLSTRRILSFDARSSKSTHLCTFVFPRTSDRFSSRHGSLPPGPVANDRAGV